MLRRRDTDQAVERAKRLKLGMYPRHQVDNNVDENGDNIDTVVRRKFYELRGTRKHMSNSFSRSIVVSHHLSSDILAGLERPDKPEKVNKDLDAPRHRYHGH